MASRPWRTVAVPSPRLTRRADGRRRASPRSPAPRRRGRRSRRVRRGRACARRRRSRAGRARGSSAGRSPPDRPARVRRRRRSAAAPGGGRSAAGRTGSTPGSPDVPSHESASTATPPAASTAAGAVSPRATGPVAPSRIASGGGDHGDPGGRQRPPGERPQQHQRPCEPERDRADPVARGDGQRGERGGAGGGDTQRGEGGAVPRRDDRHGEEAEEKEGAWVSAACTGTLSSGGVLGTDRRCHSRDPRPWPGAQKCGAPSLPERASRHGRGRRGGLSRGSCSAGRPGRPLRSRRPRPCASGSGRWRRRGGRRAGRRAARGSRRARRSPSRTGVRAPTSRPHGELMRASCSSVTPAARSRSSRSACVRRLPSAPM